MCFCWMGIHDWDEWKILRAYNILRTEDKSKIGFSILQSRKCKKCGKTQLDKQNTFI